MLGARLIKELKNVALKQLISLHLSVAFVELITSKVLFNNLLILVLFVLRTIFNSAIGAAVAILNPLNEVLLHLLGLLFLSFFKVIN